MSGTPIDLVLERLDGVVVEGTGWKAFCPGHDDQHKRSLKIDVDPDGKVLLKCFAGCTAQQICGGMGINLRDLFPPSGSGSKHSASVQGDRQRQGSTATPEQGGKYTAEDRPFRITDRYVYTDEAGQPLFRVCRKLYTDEAGGKNFFQQRYIGEGKYKGGVKGVRLVPFRLPALKAAIRDKRRIYIPEGEKDVINLAKLGLSATCNPMGADNGAGNKWTATCTEALQGAHECIVLQDNDPPDAKTGRIPGRIHAEYVAGALHDAGIPVKLLLLPDLPPKGDVSDWLEAGGKRADLERLADETPLWTRAKAEGEACQNQTDVRLPRELPEINALEQDYRVVSSQCWNALLAANRPPQFFTYAGHPARLKTQPDGRVKVEHLNASTMKHELHRVANFVSVKKNRQGDTYTIPVKLPFDVVEDMLAYRVLPLPNLVRITEVPVFAPDGSLSLEPGYHAAGATYYRPAAGLTISGIPEQPKEEDVVCARSMIEDVICDFPFVDEADRAHAIALLLLPFVRDLIDGPTPMHLVEAPSPGSGKGMLTDVMLLPSSGSDVGFLTQGGDDEDWRKRITAVLMTLPNVVRLDNVTRTIDSGSLAAVLTTMLWSDRLLGRSQIVEVPVRCAWVTTANNPTMSTEIARRCIRVRLDPKQDRPWERDGFRHADLKGWVADNRSALIRAALVLGQHWLNAGRPVPASKPLGSYELWSRVIGGILQAAEIPGFLTNLAEFYEQADVEGAKWRAFVEVWWEQFGDRDVKASDLFPLVLEMDSFNLGRGSERSQKTSFGRQLGNQRDRVVGDYRICTAGSSHNTGKYRLTTTKNLFSGDLEGDMGDIGGRPSSILRASNENDKYSIGNGGENVPPCPPCPPDTEIEEFDL